MIYVVVWGKNNVKRHIQMGTIISQTHEGNSVSWKVSAKVLFGITTVLCMVIFFMNDEVYSHLLSDILVVVEELTSRLKSIMYGTRVCCLYCHIPKMIGIKCIDYVFLVIIRLSLCENSTSIPRCFNRRFHSALNDLKMPLPNRPSSRPHIPHVSYQFIFN